MKRLLLLLLLLPLRMFGATYTVTATHLTMHAGDQVPPLIFTVSTYSGTYASVFNGQPTLSTTATSSSVAGTYPITVTAGSMSPVSGGDSLTFVAGSMVVLAPDGTGANITTSTYPSGFTTGPAFPAFNVTSNAIANLVGDGTTDNAVNMLRLLDFGRGTPFETVTVTGGTTVTTSGAWPFTGIANGSIVALGGIPNTIASVTSATVLTLGTSVTNGTYTMFLPWWKVSLSGNVVTLVSGVPFTSIPSSYLYTSSGSPGAGFIVAGVATYITVTDASHLALVNPAPQLNGATLTGVDGFLGASGSANYGPQEVSMYWPAGVYATSQNVRMPGAFWAMWGTNPQTSYIKLLPNSIIGNVTQVLPQTNEFWEPSSEGGNDNFHEFFNSLGIDVGVGNPLAIPYTTVQNNIGSVRNAVFWAEDSRCQFGVDWQRAYPGPMLFKNVSVYGCVNAISSVMGEYNLVWESGTEEGQTGTVVNDAQYMKIQWRHMLSDNAGQFLHCYGSGECSAVLLDSTLLNGNGSTAAILTATNSTIYAKNVTVTGYSPSISDGYTGTVVNTSGNITQYWSGTAQSLFNSGSTPDSLHLTVQETPAIPSIVGGTQLSAVATNWPSQIASCTGAAYAAPGQYVLSSGTVVNITVPDTCTVLQFYQSGRSSVSYTINITVAGSSSTPLTITGCIYESCNLIHSGSRTVSLVDEGVNIYTSSPGTGNLFIEDGGFGYPSITTPVFQAGQSVWARQLNNEQNGANKFDCIGCTLWILGYKTEQQHTYSVVLTSQAKAEIFGYWYYFNQTPTSPISAPMTITDSSLFAVGWSKVDSSANGLPDFITETQSGTTLNLTNPTSGSSSQLPMYYSFGASATNPFGRKLSGHHKRL